MKDLSTCQVCKGQIWESKHKYYNGTYENQQHTYIKEIIKIQKESDKNLRQLGIDTDTRVDEIQLIKSTYLVCKQTY